MTLETEPVGEGLHSDGDVVAAIDEIEGETHLVIADIARDNTWLSMPEYDVASLESWR
ncbi:hypothetical protein SAMN04487967_0317 [Natronorubrum sediminis]|uniref:Uncharacterized protein n=1 Tax=Natronorubrum sediminis TaxID=640943 RepID=A0A1H6FKI9_9EURY|nr:hypothetical protein [Natronorubrum sediminis]SEH11366.1 hypothetical protein SAMN04487967_0317 [Natronorubrum sediminis]